MAITTGFKSYICTVESEGFILQFITTETMDYPDPLIFEPLQLPHRQTFILLHGRGSWAEKFGPELLKTAIHTPETAIPNRSQDQTMADETTHTPRAPKPALTLQTAFPHARFVFPTAARRRATIYKRAHTRQWFDNWELDPPATGREELQIGGLRETAAYLHRLLRAEIATVPGGAENVVLGGLSQGCAASLVALLLWEGEELGAVVGMCGWLPFAGRLIAEVRGGEDERRDSEELGFDPFRVDEPADDQTEDGALGKPEQRAVSWLREQLNLPVSHGPSSQLPVQRIPIFLGHGERDEKVSIELGRRASECLTKLGAGVCWREYDDLGHWYSSEMLEDLLYFLMRVFGGHCIPAE